MLPKRRRRPLRSILDLPAGRQCGRRRHRSRDIYLRLVDERRRLHLEVLLDFIVDAERLHRVYLADTEGFIEENIESGRMKKKFLNSADN